jgi:hypothetical protein
MYNLLTAQQIRKNIRQTTFKDISLKAIHDIAQKLGYTQKHIGNKVGYHKSVYTALWQHIKELVDYDASLKAKVPQKALKSPKTDNYYVYNGERDNRDYEWESKSQDLHKYIMESIDELDLYHGTPHDFDEFDLAYLSTGFGQQSHGYGIYLTTSIDTAKAYSQGENIYTVEVPDGKYLNYDRIGRSEALTIARKFYKYFMTENEYGKEAYRGHEDDFWNYECKYLGECQNGGCIYGTISSFLGDDKKTSQWLYSIGYRGMYLKASNGETHEKFRNYIIFNPKDVQIIKKEKISEAKLLQGDLFSGEFSEEPIKRWKKEANKKKALKLARERAVEKKKEEDKEKRIKQYNKDSKRMVNGGLFKKEDLK